MVPVAASGGVAISCPLNGRYAFYNSPYPAHRLMTGIDIYTNSMIDESMSSPVDGEILQVRQVKAPIGNGFKAPNFDVVTIIRSSENPERVIKVLHIETRMRVGESIEVGHRLGPLIRSGYFGYQTPLHAHIEIRPLNDPLRVRGGYPIDSLLELDGLDLTEEIIGTVTASRPGYALIKLSLKTPGIVVDVGGVPGILDGGIPLYGWFGVHAENPMKDTSIKLLGKTIGKTTDIQPRTCVAECNDFRLMIESTPVDAFFMLLPNGEPTITVTSRMRDELGLELNAEISLTVE